MDALQKLIKTALAVLILLSPCILKAQKTYTWSWQRVEMDTVTFQKGASSSIKQLYNHYYPLVSKSMNEILGYTDSELPSFRPESPLSNFAADALLSAACAATGEDIDCSLTNFGGIRTSMPKGAVRLYDIYSIFPFENYLVILTLKGEILKKIYERMATNKVEAIGGVKLVIENKKLVSATLNNGRVIEDDGIYKMATLDFLLGGGDGLNLLQQNIEAREYQSLTLRDIIVNYVSAFTRDGERIKSEVDGRVKLSK